MLHRRPWRGWRACTAIVLFCTGAALAQFEPVFRKLSLTDDPAPDCPEGIQHDFSWAPVISNGHTAFVSTLKGPGTSPGQPGMWAGQAGQLRLVARYGQDVPGLAAGVQFRSLMEPVINSVGGVLFPAYLQGTGVNTANEVGLWAGTPGSLRKVARAGDQAVGAPAGTNWSAFAFTYSNFWDGTYVLNSAGRAAFLGFLTGSGVTSTNNQGIWTEGNGTLRMIARSGAAAPGTNGAVFDGFTTGGIALNGAGRTAFYSYLRGAGVDSANNRSIWIDSGGTTSLAVRAGDQIPGQGTGTRWKDFSTPSLNSAGDMAFFADLANWMGGNRQGIWVRHSDGVLDAVAEAGDAVPGFGAGITFSSFYGDRPAIDSAGRTTFRALLSGAGITSSNDTTLWTQAGGVTTLLAREGDPAVGTPAGTMYSQFGMPLISDSGITAFWGKVKGSGVVTGTEEAIWATGPDGQLHLILRAGDLFEVAPGDYRRIKTLNFVTASAGGDGRYSALSSTGELGFYASFTDGTVGDFTVMLPEPTSYLLVVLASLNLVAARRRRR